MANPVISNTSLTTMCYLVPPLSEKQQKALKIYAKANQLKAIGGTDYTAKLSSTLLSDAATLCCGMDLAERQAARVRIEIDNAKSAGATIADTISAKQAYINCLVEANEQQIDEADLLLTLALGRAKAYPQ